MSADRSDVSPLEAPLAELERALIEEFVRARGYDTRALATLPDLERAILLKEASIYASAKMTEVESRARFVHDIHDNYRRGSRSGGE